MWVVSGGSWRRGEGGRGGFTCSWYSFSSASDMVEVLGEEELAWLGRIMKVEGEEARGAASGTRRG